MFSRLFLSRNLYADLPKISKMFGGFDELKPEHNCVIITSKLMKTEILPVDKTED